MNCSYCIYANKSGNEDFVYCTYWQNESNNSKMDNEEFIRNVIFKETLLDKIALGWGFPKQHYKLESHWSYKGTATEGIMWSNQICIQKDESCIKFKSI